MSGGGLGTLAEGVVKIVPAIAVPLAGVDPADHEPVAAVKGRQLDGSRGADISATEHHVALAGNGIDPGKLGMPFSADDQVIHIVTVDITCSADR